MIHELHVADPNKTPLKWWPNVPWLQGRTTICFSEGINVLFGPNGSGKSTVLQGMAHVLACVQSGVPVVTEESVRTLTQGCSDVPMGLRLLHDGQILGYFDPSTTVGRTASGLVDDDFFEEGILSLLRKGSAGELQLFKLARLLKRKLTPLDIRMSANVNDIWQAWRRDAITLASPNAPPGPPTLLADEPERSVDIPNRVKLWQVLEKASATRQIIVAAHDPLVLDLPAHFVETEEGYIDRCRTALESWTKTRGSCTSSSE